MTSNPEDPPNQATSPQPRATSPHPRATSPHPPATSPHPPATSPHPPATSPPQTGSGGDNPKKWGTHIMGHPAAPETHPGNQEAAMWTSQQAPYYPDPYVQHSPLDRPPSSNPFEPVINLFNSWSRKAEDAALNVWNHLNIGPSVSQAAWDKVNLTAKAITGGGFEHLFKQTFQTEPNEKLIRTFACYLSTTTGPAAGTLYLSTVRVAFCSDRPMCFKAPSGQEAWSYYKVMIPLAHDIATVNPVTMREKPAVEKYIQIVTVDGHEFWFMGFVSFDKASHHLLDSLSNVRAAEKLASST